MEKIKFDLSRFQKVEKSKITNQRQEVLKMFVDRLNADRVASGRKALPPAFYATKMSMLSLQDMREFYGYCNEAKNFSATWWWRTNPKNFQ